jgi:outer membrane protein TolC
LKGILPNVRVEAGYIRTTDPTAVFGTTLRQGAVTQASFDPQRLNHPGATGNYQTGIVVEQPLVNADAWAGRRAAVYAAAATRAAEQWTQLSTRADVVRAYYGAVLAAERVAALRAAARAAHAHVAQAEAMVKQGLVTKSDALLASVRAGDVDAQLAEAEGSAVTTRRQLAVLLGRSPHLAYFGKEGRRDQQVVAGILERLALDRLAAPLEPRAPTFGGYARRRREGDRASCRHRWCRALSASPTTT